eukprot:188712_1
MSQPSNFDYLPTIHKHLVFGYNRNHQKLYKLFIPNSIMQMITIYFSFNKDYLRQFISNHTYAEQSVTAKSSIRFPKPTDIQINMMPFIMHRTFKHSKLPNYLKSYWPIIKTILDYDPTQINKIGYLTIDEALIQPNKTHRTPRAHTESPGTFVIGDGTPMTKAVQIGWGHGYINDNQQRDGIYIASTISNSCAVWKCKIIPNHKREIIGKHGDLEHLKYFLPNKFILEKNRLYWITDRTPHESLVLSTEKSVYRQFFRLVTHKLSRWYEQHCTANPNGVVPDKTITTVMKGNKFEMIDEGEKDVNCKLYVRYIEQNRYPPNANQLRAFAKHECDQLISWKEAKCIVQKFQAQ